MSIRTRSAGNYAEYLRHQSSKAILPSTQAKLEPYWHERRAWFIERFKTLKGPTGNALCLGARYGEEVSALQSLGWNTKGVDIANRSPLVEHGDMNAPILEKYDLIYTNAFDHCWEPLAFLQNIYNALNSGGCCMLHLSDGRAGAFESVEWDETNDVMSLLRSASFRYGRIVQLPIAFYGLTVETIWKK